MKGFGWINKIYNRRVTALNNLNHRKFSFYVTDRVIDQLLDQLNDYENNHGELSSPRTLNEIKEMWNRIIPLATTSQGVVGECEILTLGKKSKQSHCF